MRDNRLHRRWRLGGASGIATLALLLFPIARVQAADPLGIYLGGAFGQARVEATLPDATRFGEDHSAFKILAGLRPIPLLGAEVEYLDFGHPRHSFPNGGESDVSMKGAAAFGMLYVPVPLVEVYAKGGLARLESTAFTNPCPLCLGLAVFAPLSRTNTSWAAGAGAQFKLGAVGIRAEYERFNAADRSPYLVSLGATWTF